MTPELTYLAYTAVLTALLWMPYAVGLAVKGAVTADSFRDPTPPELPAWVKRCNRAHINAVESIAPFAVLVLIAHLAGISTEMTALWAMIYFLARLAHAVIYWLGIPFLRTLAFATGLIATLGLFYEVIFTASVA
ncbi:MAG: MAPEG family protein [Pseudomonadota bacterium]